MTAKEKYRLFLKSPFWLELSTRVKAKAGRCQRCKSRDRLQAHHRIYRDDWRQTREEDLIALCRKCHAAEHGLAWDARDGPRDMMLYRGDWGFSLTVYRLECLTRMVVSGRRLRKRDGWFMIRCLKSYPPTSTDSCIEFKVRHLRDLDIRLRFSQASAAPD